MLVYTTDSSKKKRKEIKKLLSKMLLFLLVILLIIQIFRGTLLLLSAEDQSISLITSSTNLGEAYVIENDYYKAIIPKASASAARGIIKWLYVKKSNGQWSNNLITENAFNYDYGLGYLEGTGKATDNRYAGMQNSSNINITVLENTTTKVKIQSSATYLGTLYTEIWTFWAKKPYFKSEAVAEVIDKDGFLTNQFQFCWMINDNLTSDWFATDKNGDITQLTSVIMQPLHGPNLNTYPWINWQFSDETVSLGLVFTNINDYYGTVAETGDWKFEYQLDFALGSGILGNPVKNGFKREVTTVYYTTNQATNNNINSFVKDHYQYATTSIVSNPLLQAAQYVDNPYGQNFGIGSALVSSPYFLVRQNTQNRHNNVERTQYATSIYAPLYKNQQAIHSGSYDFQEQLLYSLNYNNDSQTFDYGTIVSASSTNSDYETGLQMTAISSDNELLYSSTFKTWNDSDKLKIIGTVSNNDSFSTVKDIWVSLYIPNTYDEIKFQPIIQNISSNIYDVRLYDDVYGKMGIGIKINSPTDNVSLMDTSTDLRIYLYTQETVQPLTTFNYSFDIEIYPHEGWLTSASEFTALHSKNTLTYTKHNLYLPENVTQDIIYIFRKIYLQALSLSR
jgi:hypothetical protein